MRSFLQTVYLDNTIESYLVCLGAILLVLLLNRYLSRYISAAFFRVLNRTSLHIQRETFIRLLRGPINVFLLLLVVFLTFDKLNFPRVLQFTIHRISFRQIIDSTGNAALTVAFTWLLLRLIDFIASVLQQRADLTQTPTDNQLVVFFKDFLKVIVIFIGLLLLIRFTFYKDVATLLAGFGIVGAALALAARESLENLIASFIIFFDKPFYPGDIVKVQGITGTVERIGLRSTRIRTDQKTYVTVPNKQMVDTILDNLSLRTQRRGFLALEINSSSSYDQVNELLQEIEQITLARKDRIVNHSVVLADINKNSYVIQVEYFTGPVPMEEFNRVRQQLNLSIIRYMEEKGIKLASKEEIVLAQQAASREE
ncbi:MAG: mechanosensitive ion channel family protein [Williamsia sp.]|nr:mechanosensitive ion channel family protein [Williamsia sp.]